MKFNRHIITGFVIILILALSRLIPHPPNFTPILGMAVFSGAVINHKLIAYIIPLAAMLLSDLYLGLHASMPIIYFSLAICVLIGTLIESKVTILNSLLSLSFGVLAFFLITNFAVWYGSGMYELSISGLMTSYFMGLPFVQNTFISSLMYGMGAFLIYDIINKRRIFGNNA
tara:strand:- start:1195 stop:1710 length:516 start_codon:yes stop_codon:yes gene_type:complete